MKYQTNLRRAIFLSLATLLFTGSAMLTKHALGQAKDKIKYNVVYDCGESQPRVKILSCEGQRGDDRCEIFMINKYSPGGGYKDHADRSYVLNHFVNQCTPEGGNAEVEQPANSKAVEKNNPAVEDKTTNDKTAAEDPPAEGDNEVVKCPASDPDSKGKTALEKSFRGAIRTSFEREPKPGEDGRVTVTIQGLSIGQAHPYRVRIDPSEAIGKTIYPIRATFTACTDYNRRIVLDTRERAFACYKNTMGEWVCDIFAAANTNVKDQSKSIDKPKR